MIVVGELINASRKSIAAAIEKQDSSFIQQVARDQATAGANYIDVNAGTFVGKEADYLNQTFMAMAIARGLDGAIVNPLDRRMMGTIISAEALAGRDNYCMKYLKAHRGGVFETESS